MFYLQLITEEGKTEDYLSVQRMSNARAISSANRRNSQFGNGIRKNSNVESISERRQSDGGGKRRKSTIGTVGNKWNSQEKKLEEKGSNIKVTIEDTVVEIDEQKTVKEKYSQMEGTYTANPSDSLAVSGGKPNTASSDITNNLQVSFKLNIDTVIS